jgi:hypothetical protein
MTGQTFKDHIAKVAKTDARAMFQRLERVLQRRSGICLCGLCDVILELLCHHDRPTIVQHDFNFSPQQVILLQDLTYARMQSSTRHQLDSNAWQQCWGK